MMRLAKRYTGVALFLASLVSVSACTAYEPGPYYASAPGYNYATGYYAYDGPYYYGGPYVYFGGGGRGYWGDRRHW
jgi:hypothetical protein